jgi:hypothetical protein
MLREDDLHTNDGHYSNAQKYVIAISRKTAKKSAPGAPQFT